MWCSLTSSCHSLREGQHKCCNEFDIVSRHENSKFWSRVSSERIPKQGKDEQQDSVDPPSSIRRKKTTLLRPCKCYRFPHESRAVFPQPVRQLQTPVSMLVKRLHRPLMSSNGVTALASDLLQLPLLGELLVETLQLLNELTAGTDDSVLGGDGAVGLDTQLEAGK